MASSRHHAKLFEFLTILAYSRVFLLKNGRTWCNLHIVSKFVQTWHGSLPWACSPAGKTWGLFMHVRKYTMFNMEGVQVGHMGPYESNFFWHLQMIPNFIHELIWSIQGTNPSCLCFWQFLYSLEFSQWKWLINGQTSRNVHKVSEFIQTRHGWLPFACPSASTNWCYPKNVQN